MIAEYRNPKPYIFGLTGGIATGKSTVAQKLSKHFPIVDADQIAAEVVRPGTAALLDIEKRFGKTYIQPDGTLDRQLLGQRIFSDKGARNALNQIMHPRIQALAKQRFHRLANQGHTIIFYDIPLLFETNSAAQFEAVVVVACTEEQQLERLQIRNKLSRKEALDRIRAQMPLEDKVKRADYVIDNSTTLEELDMQVQLFIKQIQIYVQDQLLE